LFPAVPTDQHMRPGFDPKRLARLATSFTDKPTRPTNGLKISGAGKVIGKELLELGQGARKRQIVGIEHGPSFLTRILHHVPVCVNRIIMLTTILGIVGAFLATYLGQALGWYRADQSAGLIGAVVGAIIILVVWGFIAGRR